MLLAEPPIESVRKNEEEDSTDENALPRMGDVGNVSVQVRPQEAFPYGKRLGFVLTGFPKSSRAQLVLAER